MFTIAQIESAHTKVKSGADFPAYISEIKSLGVKSFETFVVDSHTEYSGQNGFKTSSEPQYENLEISETVHSERFKLDLESHQKGQTDYFTFCRDCAKSGIVKWVCDLAKMTCTYFDTFGNRVLIETIPG